MADLNGDDDKKTRSRKSPSDFGSMQASSVVEWEKEHLIEDLKKVRIQSSAVCSICFLLSIFSAKSKHYLIGQKNVGLIFRRTKFSSPPKKFVTFFRRKILSKVRFCYTLRI